MIVYSLFPLIACLCNLIIGTYILYRNPRNRMNILYAMVAYGLGAWGAGDFLVFVSLSESSALFYDKISTAASILAPAFLLHFFLVFSRNRLASGRGVYILYVPAVLFLLVGMFTPLISPSAEVSYWGYNILEGGLYLPVVIYIVTYVVLGLLVCYRFHSKSRSKKKRKQSTLLVLSILILLVGGVVSEGVLPLLGIQVMPLTSTLSVITGAIIAYTIIKYRLMVPFSFRIRSKLMTVFLIILLSFLLILFFTVNTFSRDMVEAQAADNLRGVAGQKLNWIDSYLSERISDADILSRLPTVLDALEKGSVLEAESGEYIHDFAESYGYYDIFLVAPEGDVIWSVKEEGEAGENLNRGNFNDTELAGVYMRMINSSGPLISDYEIHVHTGEPCIYIGSPVFAGDEIAGEVILQMDVGQISAIMRDSSGLGETGETYLVGRDHYLRSDLRFEDNVILTERIDTVNVESCFRKDREAGKPLVYENYEHSLVLGTHFYMEDYDLCLIAEISEEEILEPSYNMMNMIVMLFVVILAAAFAATFLTARSITKPLVKLRDAARKIGKGDIDTKIDIKSGDEVGDLARDFGHMVKEWKRSRKKLEGYSRELEKQVKKRTGELENRMKEMEDARAASLNIMEDIGEANKKLEKRQRQIKKANRELKKMDKLKSEFMNIGAHELKTPLIPIVGYLDMMKDGKNLNDSQKTQIKTCLRNAKRLQLLVNDILDMSKLEAGSMKFEMGKVDILSVIKNSVTDMKEEAKKQGMELKSELPDSLPEITADEYRITQVLTNLINNAIKYNRPKGSITVSASRGDGKIKVSVSDTGIGISKKDMKKLFTKFFQADTSARRKHGGTGLGLAICRSIVRHHGGKIWTESKLGKGSRFIFTLPIKKQGWKK